MAELAPVIYEHAAALIGKTPWEVSRSEQLLTDAHLEAFKRYNHSPVVVGIDIYNIEIECYGAQIAQPQGSAIPAAADHICKSLEDCLGLKPFDPSADGRCRIVVNAAKNLKKLTGGADVRVPVSGPFSIASGLLGFDALLMACVLDSDVAAQAIMHLAENQSDFVDFVTAEGLKISLFESAATPPLISPDMFEQIELPALKKLCETISKASDAPAACILGGDTAPIIESLLETGTKYVICPAETDQELFMRKMCGFPDVHVRINMDPAVMVKDDHKLLKAELDRVLKIASIRENVSIGTGVLPYEAIPENVDFARSILKK